MYRAPFMIGMNGVDLRYMQISFTIEEGATLPGVGLTSDFDRVEFLTKLEDTDEGMRALIRMEFQDISILEKEQHAYRVLRILEQSETSAICEIIATGPLSLLFSRLEHVWWVSPTYVHSDGMLMTVRGTGDGLREIKKNLWNFLPAGYRMKLGAESLHSPEFIELLPERQRVVLEKAIEMGYYDRPRRCTQRDIAESLDIKQATVSEHLQSAEASIIHAFTTEP